MKQTISNEEIRADYERFLRHEAMRAYKDTEEIKELIKQTCRIEFMLVPKINIKAVEDGKHKR